jgi:hypothetical protein
LEEASPHFKGCLPPVFVADSDVVVPPLYVKFAEEFHSLEVFDAFCEVGEWGYVFACDGVEGSIIYNISQLV